MGLKLKESSIVFAHCSIHSNRSAKVSCRSFCRLPLNIWKTTTRRAKCVKKSHCAPTKTTLLKTSLSQKKKKNHLLPRQQLVSAPFAKLLFTTWKHTSNKTRLLLKSNNNWIKFVL